MVKCKECKWWEKNVGANGTVKPDGECQLATTEFSGERVHEESLAHAVSGEEAFFHTDPAFGCVQGEFRDSQAFETKVHAVRPLPPPGQTFTVATIGTTSLSVCVGDLFVHVPRLDGEVFEDGCEVVVTVERKHRKAGVCE